MQFVNRFARQRRGRIIETLFVILGLMCLPVLLFGNWFVSAYGNGTSVAVRPADAQSGETLAGSSGSGSRNSDADGSDSRFTYDSIGRSSDDNDANGAAGSDSRSPGPADASGMGPGIAANGGTVDPLAGDSMGGAPGGQPYQPPPTAEAFDPVAGDTNLTAGATDLDPADPLASVDPVAPFNPTVEPLDPVDPIDPVDPMGSVGEVTEPSAGIGSDLLGPADGSDDLASEFDPVDPLDADVLAGLEDPQGSGDDLAGVDPVEPIEPGYTEPMDAVTDLAPGDPVALVDPVAVKPDAPVDPVPEVIPSGNLDVSGLDPAIAAPTETPAEDPASVARTWTRLDGQTATAVYIKTERVTKNGASKWYVSLASPKNPERIFKMPMDRLCADDIAFIRAQLEREKSRQ